MDKDSAILFICVMLAPYNVSNVELALLDAFHAFSMRSCAFSFSASTHRLIVTYSHVRTTSTVTRMKGTRWSNVRPTFAAWCRIPRKRTRLLRRLLPYGFCRILYVFCLPHAPATPHFSFTTTRLPEKRRVSRFRPPPNLAQPPCLGHNCLVKGVE